MARAGEATGSVSWAAARRRRRPTLRRVHSLGIDIGGTSIKAGIVGPEGIVGEVRQVPTALDPDDIVAATLALARDFDGVERVGVAVAAFVDPAREYIELSPNIAWEGRPLRRELEDALQFAVVLENDANAAGVAEYTLGAGREAHSMVMLTLGTGVGGAVVLDGNVLPGARGVAGELGHIVVEPGGALCGCGQRGCVETVSSGTALLRMAGSVSGRQLGSADELERVLRDAPELRATLLQQMADGVISALVQIQAVVDPALAVIGGGVAERLGAELFAALTRGRHDVVEGRRSAAFPQIVPAHLGNTAGVIGAGLLAQRLEGPPAH